MNIFTFNHQYYKQIRGSPMGSPLSSIVAEIVMVSLDERINQQQSSSIYFWKRYIDDIFCFTKIDSVSHILKDLNSFHPDISFTYETETSLVLPFLDILIIRTNNFLHTTVYYKNNSAPHYTHYSSHCPITHKISLVKTLTKRIFTHCSLNIFQNIEKSKIIAHLTKANYPISFINRHFYNPNYKKPAQINKDHCTLPYSPQSVAIASILKPYGINTFYYNNPNIASITRNPITRSNKPTNNSNSEGAVYAVPCRQCSAIYVGETVSKFWRVDCVDLPLTFILIMNPSSEDLPLYIRQLKKKSLQVSKWRCHLKFNQICEQANFIPPSLRIKDPVGNPFSAQIVRHAQMQLLKSRTKGCFSNIRFISKCIKGLIYLLTKLLPEHEMVDLITSITRAVQNQIITITKRHRSKLNYWVNRYNFPESCNITNNQDIKGIINLSSESLTPSENRLLSLGLKFRLPKTPDIPRIISCLEPAIKSLSHQDTFKIRQAVTSILQKPVPHTKESKGLYQTIKKLKQNTSIVITRSDKGSDIVILNTADYASKMHDILSDTSIFSPITPQDNTTAIRKFRTSLLRLKRSKHISQDRYSTFISNLNSNAYIYGLPKTHKPSVPLRPVIAYHQSPAYAVSKFLSNFLSPILHSKPGTHAITNTPSFIKEITKLKVPKDHIMVSFDVKSLYLSLPHPLIISELRKPLYNIPIDTHTADYIINLTSLCLDMNIFTFNHQYYKQIRGSTMGSPLSSIVAEIVMVSLDERINQQQSSSIYFWKRYIDDIFCITKIDSFSHILKDLNSFHPDISFTYETETSLVLPFLDILIIRTNNFLHTTVYYKNNSAPHYTHYSSHCPITHKISLVKTLTKRIFTHCSLNIFQYIEKSKIIAHLTKANYPISFINRHFYNPNYTKPAQINKDHCTLPYSPQSVAIASILKPYGINTFYYNNPNIASITRNPITRSNKPTNKGNSEGAVYAVPCRQCSAIYVGETDFKENGLTLNQSKSKIVVFRNGGCLARSDVWFWGQQPLTVSSKYTYLGYPLTTKNPTAYVVQHFKSKALVATNAVWRILSKSRTKSFGAVMKLLDSIVLSTLLYSAQLWATNQIRVVNQIQDIFLRRFLDLPKYTPGYILRTETGRMSLELNITKLILEFWIRILKNRQDKITLCLLVPALESFNNYMVVRGEMPRIVQTTVDQLLQFDRAKIQNSTHFIHYQSLSSYFMTEDYLLSNLSLKIKRFIARQRILWLLFREDITGFWNSDPLNFYF
ncbi:hypothetical protein LAZ67_20000978 [Cordylochernes scorpioides]|uniref:Reverse transcriptase domain-containing protein n=1 Tax=Cordylochernes scorpioides TaxID=51811 RepID=A0ABY6LJJ1_9ARAC|nr:hypothetical protein LAZ67_20000978 [Cordylochernes scorpioides]